MNMQYRTHIFTYLVYLVLINHWFIICFTSRIGIDRKAIATNNFQISSILWIIRDSPFCECRMYHTFLALLFSHDTYNNACIACD